jgi:hypothetical protein
VGRIASATRARFHSPKTFPLLMLRARKIDPAVPENLPKFKDLIRYLKEELHLPK